MEAHRHAHTGTEPLTGADTGKNERINCGQFSDGLIVYITNDVNSTIPLVGSLRPARVSSTNLVGLLLPKHSPTF
jgi:hypothetical protein